MIYGLDRADHLRLDRRITIISLVIFLLFLGIVIRLFWLQIVLHKNFVAIAEKQHVVVTTVDPARGEIFARDHTNISSKDLYPLAANKIYYEVYVDPSKVSQPQNTADALAQALDLRSEDIIERLKKTADNYEPIKHKVTEEQLAAVQKIQLPGIHFQKEVWRFYPDKDIGAQLLGFYGVQDDKKRGVYGLESYWNNELSGQGLTSKFERTLKNGLVPDADTAGSVVDGADIILTIDRTIQYQACRALDRAVATLGAEDGSLVIMETETGRILSLCNSPSFDPNNYGEVEDVKDFNNNAVYEAYEPGSAFKVVAMSIALDNGQVTPSTTYEDTGVVKLAGFSIKNSDKLAHGLVTMTGVLEKSLNTGMIFATQNVENKTFEKYIKNFGFGQLYNAQMDQESKGDISSLAKSGEIHKATASFGQGITVTPLQLVSAVNVIANDGKLMQPYIVEETRYPDGHVVKNEPKVLRQVIKPQTASQVGAMMVSVVDNGFGKKAGVPGYYIAGKTGTAQVAENGAYGGKTVQSFVGFGPVEKPRFTMITKLTNPSGAGWAESSAAPLFGEIASFLMKYYQIAPSR
jgi:cell division protein FtsI/penicillin-binding protein 2